MKACIWAQPVLVNISFDLVVQAVMQCEINDNRGPRPTRQWGHLLTPLESAFPVHPPFFLLKLPSQQTRIWSSTTTSIVTTCICHYKHYFLRFFPPNPCTITRIVPSHCCWCRLLFSTFASLSRRCSGVKPSSWVVWSCGQRELEPSHGHALFDYRVEDRSKEGAREKTNGRMRVYVKRFEGERKYV